MREISRYMFMSEKPKENRVTIDLAELFEWLPLVFGLSRNRHVLLLWNAAQSLLSWSLYYAIFYRDKWYALLLTN